MEVFTVQGSVTGDVHCVTDNVVAATNAAEWLMALYDAEHESDEGWPHEWSHDIIENEYQLIHHYRKNSEWVLIEKHKVLSEYTG